MEKAEHRPTGGDKKVEEREFVKIDAKVRSRENIHYMPGGGRKQVFQEKLHWQSGARIGSFENVAYKPQGGDIKIEERKLEFRKKAQSKIGSFDYIDHNPGGGDIEIESYKVDYRENAQARIGFWDNYEHEPAGGEVKIYDERLPWLKYNRPNLSEEERLRIEKRLSEEKPKRPIDYVRCHGPGTPQRSASHSLDRSKKRTQSVGRGNSNNNNASHLECRDTASHKHNPRVRFREEPIKQPRPAPKRKAKKAEVRPSPQRKPREEKVPRKAQPTPKRGPAPKRPNKSLSPAPTTQDSKPKKERHVSFSPKPVRREPQPVKKRRVTPSPKRVKESDDAKDSKTAAARRSRNSRPSRSNTPSRNERQTPRTDDRANKTESPQNATSNRLTPSPIETDQRPRQSKSSERGGRSSADRAKDPRKESQQKRATSVDDNSRKTSKATPRSEKENSQRRDDSSDKENAKVSTTKRPEPFRKESRSSKERPPSLSPNGKSTKIDNNEEVHSESPERKITRAGITPAKGERKTSRVAAEPERSASRLSREFSPSERKDSRQHPASRKGSRISAQETPDDRKSSKGSIVESPRDKPAVEDSRKVKESKTAEERRLSAIAEAETRSTSRADSRLDRRTSNKPSTNQKSSPRKGEAPNIPPKEELTSTLPQISDDEEEVLNPTELSLEDRLKSLRNTNSYTERFKMIPEQRPALFPAPMIRPAAIKDGDTSALVEWKQKAPEIIAYTKDKERIVMKPNEERLTKLPRVAGGTDDEEDDVRDILPPELWTHPARVRRNFPKPQMITSKHLNIILPNVEDLLSMPQQPIKVYSVYSIKPEKPEDPHYAKAHLHHEHPKLYQYSLIASEEYIDDSWVNQYRKQQPPPPPPPPPPPSDIVEIRQEFVNPPVAGPPPIPVNEVRQPVVQLPPAQPMPRPAPVPMPSNQVPAPLYQPITSTGPAEGDRALVPTVNADQAGYSESEDSSLKDSEALHLDLHSHEKDRPYLKWKPGDMPYSTKDVGKGYSSRRKPQRPLPPPAPVKKQPQSRFTDFYQHQKTWYSDYNREMRERFPRTEKITQRDLDGTQYELY